MRIPTLILVAASFGFTLGLPCQAQSVPSAKQLENWLKRFPDADANRDGTLTIEEANRYRQTLQSRANRQGNAGGANRGAPREFNVDPGWDRERFPEHAVCYLPPQQIKAIFEQSVGGKRPAVVSFEKPRDGALRIVGTGHSFMAPGYRTFPIICKAAGMTQPLYTHTGGGMTGSTRYKWEQENGIFDFEGRPEPKLLASIANAKWDAMMWGPYFNDRPVYYSCWIDFCLKYNPDMKFYLSDAWPQLYQLGTNPKSESFFTEEVFDRLGAERRAEYSKQVEVLRKQYPDKIFIMPTSDAMVLAAKSYLRGELPGVEGIHRVIGGKERSLWRDQLGHIGPGFDRLEGYVFYATLYGKSPELIDDAIPFGGNDSFPGPRLDQTFRKIAWQAVIGHPLSGVKDEDGDRVDDVRDR
ncbi:hypothetical protein Enr13x_03550 [Stieleria neptunia]|uniref:EF-hand domain-containing protein n=1 Tax=Stieleria neptunia TaxID=2527979 RepID=A0A518HIA3_9BACT|nr:hypothetical protein [Stieleria neptunia]QDV40549.1 hypothetical protein Enr13x_03550 [Stieleria neptunia]